MEHLTSLLAERIMGWSVAPGRFLTGDRRWKPRWRFQPTESLVDAFQLLDAARPEEYSMGARGAGQFWARVRLHDSVGEAQDRSKPRAITYALARALGIQVDQ